MSSEGSATAYAPATVGNVICGFDVFGLALDHPGDRVTVRFSDRPGLRIAGIEGDSGKLPTDAARNSATVAIAALLRAAGRSDDLEVTIEKGLPLSGGMGGSAASSVAGAVAADALLGTGFPPDALLEFALAGEGMAAGSAHLDNVAPALYGGLLLVRPTGRPRVVRLPVPKGLSVAVLHPAVELSTREGRKALGTSVPLAEAVAQWGSTAAFVHALHTSDWDLLQDALVDRVAEPHRKGSIPGFDAVRSAAMAAGALACGISGAGPSLVAFTRDEERTKTVGEAMLSAYRSMAGPAARLYLCAVATAGARITSSATSHQVP
jgi:homoserine kinase